MEAVRGGRTRCVEILVANGAKIKAQDASGDTAAHIASRCNRGGLIVTMINESESKESRSSTGFLEIKNFKGETCEQVAKSDRVLKIIENAREAAKTRAMARKGALMRMRKGAVKAKVLGNQAGGKALTKIKAKRRRYAGKKH